MHKLEQTFRYKFGDTGEFNKLVKDWNKEAGDRAGDFEINSVIAELVEVNK